MLDLFLGRSKLIFMKKSNFSGAKTYLDPSPGWSPLPWHAAPNNRKKLFVLAHSNMAQYQTKEKKRPAPFYLAQHESSKIKLRWNKIVWSKNDKFH